MPLMELGVNSKKKRKNILFRSKQTTKKSPPNMFRGFKISRKGQEYNKEGRADVCRL